MGEACAVCKKGTGPVKCEVCGFSDSGAINREFPIIEDLNHWFETVVNPHRMQWIAELMAQIEELKNQLAVLSKQGVIRVALGRSEAYFESRAYNRAIEELSEAIRLDPNSARAYATRGDAHRMKGQCDEAIKDCTKAIRLNPEHAGAYATRGQADRMKGQYDEAIGDYTKAIGLAPEYAWAYAARGDAHRMKGQYDEAIKDCTEAIRLDPEYAVAYGLQRETY